MVRILKVALRFPMYSTPPLGPKLVSPMIWEPFGHYIHHNKYGTLLYHSSCCLSWLSINNLVSRNSILMHHAWLPQTRNTLLALFMKLRVSMSWNVCRLQPCDSKECLPRALSPVTGILGVISGTQWGIPDVFLVTASLSIAYCLIFS